MRVLFNKGIGIVSHLPFQFKKSLGETATVSADTYVTIQKAVDEIVAMTVPQDFPGVGQWYEDFSQTTDKEVRQILAEAAGRIREPNE